MPTVIPVGYSKVSHFIQCPAPGGSRVSVVTYGSHCFPSHLAATGFGTFWNALWDNIGSTESTVVKTEVRDSTMAFEFTTTQDGSVSGAIVPPQVALLVRKNSGLVGKTNRGRMYLPCTLRPDDVDDSGHVKSTPLGNIQADLDTWGGSVEGDPNCGPFVILHTSVDQEPTLITSITAESVVATQKRRLGRRAA